MAVDLEKIVVLCAADPTSKEFKQAWITYVSRHKLHGEALEKAKRQVVDEAFRHRQEYGPSTRRRGDDAAWRATAERTLEAISVAKPPPMKELK